MWTFLIEVYIKPYDVILTPLLTCKAVHIQCPLFDFRHTFDMGVVSLTIQVHILSAKGEFHHAVMVARKYDFRQRVARRCLLPLIGVFDAQFRKTFRHTFRDGLRFVDGLYLTTFGNLEVQMVACRVILPASHLHLLRMVIPFPLVFVAFVHGHSLAGFDVHDLFLSACHNDIVCAVSAGICGSSQCRGLAGGRCCGHRRALGGADGEGNRETDL